MSGQHSGSTKYRKLSTICLMEHLWDPIGREAQSDVEEAVGIKHGMLKIYRSRTNQKNRGMEEWEFAKVAARACARDRLKEQFIFEFGLWRLVDTPLADFAIEGLLNNRHAANKIFANGIKRMSLGKLPLPPSPKGGTPKNWVNASPEERRAAFYEWLNDIEELGCRVVDAEEWCEWFRMADAASTMEQFLWYWGDNCQPGEASCPPWVFGLDVDYWDNFGALNSPELLDCLVLVTESDMPYRPYHARFEQPGRMSSALSAARNHSTLADDEGVEWESEASGDDIGAWIRERQLRSGQLAGKARAVIDRARRRRNGVANH